MNNQLIKLKKDLIILMSGVITLGTAALGCEKANEMLTSPSMKDDPISTVIPGDSIKKKTVFDAGQDGVYVYRIPSLITAADGSLLLFAEARKTSWRDKSPTDLVLKRSTDQGQTWSSMTRLLNGGSNAYMDPCALVDRVTGRIFVFTCLWPASDHSSKTNTMWLMTSDDHGATWSAAKNMTAQILPNGYYLNGFGPGSGMQMSKSSAFKDRLIMPIRLYDGSRTRNRTLYSDDHGQNWQLGSEASDGGEFQIAESPYGTLVNTRRGDAMRYKSKSTDGGITWSQFAEDKQLRSISGGIQGSFYGVDSVLFYTGPAGGAITENTDNRSNLMIYRSRNGGETWTRQHLLYNRASGYSCMTRLNDGRFAVVFESADTQGFSKLADRSAGWMRLDVIMLPKQIVLKDHWFSK